MEESKNMRYEIIHLTDFHIKNNFNYETLIEKMIDSLLFENDDIYNTLFLCITGDITQAGQKKSICFI